MSEFIYKDFSAGWCPSDDAINGRKNALLKMDSVELDQNGALTLTSGISNWNSFNYPASAHTLYSKFLNGLRVQYLALKNGMVYRNTNSIIIGGATTRAAFYAAYNFIFIFSGTQRKRDAGALLSNIGITQPLAPTIAASGAVNSGGVLTGDYYYTQQAVYNTGTAYFAKSSLSPLTSKLTLTGQNVTVTPSRIVSPANEYWIFRRGGNLDDWYRIAVVSNTSPFIDSMSDIDALTLNERTNIYITTTDINGINDDILEVVGPIYGRALLFTAKNIYFSLINSPDSYDTRTTIGFGSAQNTGAEQFLWARKLGENIIVIGTTQEVYILTGTFVQLPDGFLDVYLRPLGVNNPPISPAAAVYNNQIVYMGSYGWRILSLDGSSESLVAPNTDILYKGYTRFGYGGVPSYVYPATDALGNIVRFSCVVAKNKLWCIVPYIVDNKTSNAFKYRMEIYDFIRKYWRTINIFPTALTIEDDNAVTGFFEDANGNNLRQIDAPAINSISKTFNGINQTINILTIFQDADTRHNRKDTFTVKLIIFTGGTNVTFNIYKNLNSDVIVYSTIINTINLTEVTLDVNNSLGFCKMWQFGFIGSPLDFILESIAIEYNLRPQQLSYLKLPVTNFEIAGRKRIFLIPYIIDTLGNQVKITPIVDSVTKSSLIVANFEKTTELLQFNPEILGKDFQTIIQAILPKKIEPSIQPGVLYEDNFARSDGSLGNTWIDLNSGTSSFFIVNTKLRFDGGSALAYFISDVLTDCFSEIIYNTKNGSGTYLGLIVRGTGNSWPFVFGYMVHIDIPEAGFNVGRYIQQGSSFDIVESYVTGVLPTLVTGDKLRLEIQGTIISFKLNGVILGSANFSTSSVQYASGRLGIVIRHPGGSFGPDFAEITKWRGGSLPEITPEPPKESTSFPVFEFYEQLTPKSIEILPDPLTFYRSTVSNFGIPNKKRIRVWPIVLDSLGSNVTFTPYVDGIAQPSTIFNDGIGKKTYFYFFTTDVFGIDYNFTLNSFNIFEFYEEHSPDIVQVLPIARRYDQIGPSEILMYSKIRKMVFNLISFGGMQIPYSVLLNNIENQHGIINTTDSKDGIFELNFGKTVSGNILRIILGPTSFNFHRLSTKILASKAGIDSELTWISLDEQK